MNCILLKKKHDVAEYSQVSDKSTKSSADHPGFIVDSDHFPLNTMAIDDSTLCSCRFKNFCLRLILDSGAGKHVVGDKLILTSLETTTPI